MKVFIFCFCWREIQETANKQADQVMSTVYVVCESSIGTMRTILVSDNSIFWFCCCFDFARFRLFWFRLFSFVLISSLRFLLGSDFALTEVPIANHYCFFCCFNFFFSFFSFYFLFFYSSLSLYFFSYTHFIIESPCSVFCRNIPALYVKMTCSLF